MRLIFADVAELVDVPDLGSGAVRRGGSSPFVRTNNSTMNITRENTDGLNAVIKVLIEKNDYGKNVADKLKEYRKKASLPGFRPGFVPASLIQKRFGKAILAEEVNQLLSHNLAGYFKEENLSILGEPLPNETIQKPIDWDADDDFEFVFDVALTPQIDIPLSKTRVPYYRIKVTGEMIDNQISNILNRMGKNVPVEVAGEKSLLRGDFCQLDAEGNDLSEGICPKGVLISADLIKDEVLKGTVLGMKPGESMVFDPVVAYGDRHEVGHMLNISHEEAEKLDSNFRFTINEIQDFEPAGISEALFTQIYGENTEVKTVEEFRDRVAEEISSSFNYSSDQKFGIDARNILLSESGLTLPEEFLKRWLKAANKGMSDEEIEKDFNSFLIDLQWQLIKNSISAANNLKVEEEELINYARSLAVAQYNQHGIFDISEDHVERLSKMILEKEEERERIYRRISEGKVIQVIREQAEVEYHEISKDEFSEMMK